MLLRQVNKWSYFSLLLVSRLEWVGVNAILTMDSQEGNMLTDTAKPTLCQLVT